jgi:DinB superfamily
MQCERLDIPVIARKTDFPSVYRGIATRDLITVYKAGPTRLGGAVSGLVDEELKARPRDGKWSVQEIALHVADAEIMGAARMRQAWAEPGSAFAVYDQNAWANELDYRGRTSGDVFAALHLFSVLRLTGTRLLENASPEDWKKWGSHLEWGTLTVRQILELYADHAERHVEQIVGLRALLGKPIHIPKLLPKRLY